MTLIPDDIIRMMFAALVGGLIGFEREYRDKAAGVRTSMLISMGAAFFTILSYRLGGENDIRVAVGIVSGVGFLGAGVIMRDGGHVTGLTTACTIWLVAALGMGAGGGQYLLVGSITAVILAILWVLRPFERWVTGLRDEHTYHMVLTGNVASAEKLGNLFTNAGLKVLSMSLGKKDGKVTCTWEVVGPPSKHDAVVEKLATNPAIQDLEF